MCLLSKHLLYLSTYVSTVPPLEKSSTKGNTCVWLLKVERGISISKTRSSLQRIYLSTRSYVLFHDRGGQWNLSQSFDFIETILKIITHLIRRDHQNHPSIHEYSKEISCDALSSKESFCEFFFSPVFERVDFEKWRTWKNWKQ